jgi:hypothetical protein
MRCFRRVELFSVTLLLLLLIAHVGLMIPSHVEGVSDYRYRTRGGYPPGLAKALLHSHRSEHAKEVLEDIFLGGHYGVKISKIAVVHSSSNQMIQTIDNNETVVHIGFDVDGTEEVIINSTAKPAAVYADDLQLSESQSTAGLTPESEAWVYDQNNGVITIFADPTTITLFYGSTPIPEFPVASVSLLLLVILTAAISIVALTRGNRLHARAWWGLRRC